MKIFYRLLVVSFLSLSFFVINAGTSYAFGNSDYESHHIFPQRYFNHLGDDACFQLTEFEHKWVENSGAYTNDWDKWDGWFTNPFTDDGEITNYGARCAALAAGQRILSYHLFTVDHNKSVGNGERETSGLLATKFDLWSNLIYNISYITATPAKLIHFLSWALPQSDTFYNQPSKIYLIVWSLKEAVLGLIQAFIMLVVGPIIGLVSHPFWSLAGVLISLDSPIRINLISTILWLIGAIIGPIVYIFWW